MMRPQLHRLVAVVLVAGGCIDVATEASQAVDVTGPWNYRASQLVPAAQLDGQWIIEVQDGSLVGGRAVWDARFPTGEVQPAAGALSGRVIGASDIDFDVLLASGSRRHLGRLSGDTISGTWVTAGGGAGGSFTAVRRSE